MDMCVGILLWEKKRRRLCVDKRTSAVFTKCEGNLWGFQCALVVVDIGKKKIRNVVGKTRVERRKMNLLIAVKIREKF